MNITLKISKISQYQYNRVNATNNSIEGDFKDLLKKEKNIIIRPKEIPGQQQINEINKKNIDQQKDNQFQQPNNIKIIEPQKIQTQYSLTLSNPFSQNNSTMARQEPGLNYKKFNPKYFKLYFLGTLLILILSIIIFVQYENVGTLVNQVFIFLLSIIMSSFYYFKGKLDLFEERNAKTFTNLFLLDIVLSLTAIIVSIAVQDIYGYQIVNFITIIIMFLYYYNRVRQKNQQQ